MAEETILKPVTNPIPNLRRIRGANAKCRQSVMVSEDVGRSANKAHDLI